ncbi:alpha/beta hydrolase [Colwellia sp. MT41]|uniref:alpha/beta hydrolase n=1 Tax=Colwellia sp. MT41 TaxID=58049 RepID=UPI000A626899|nr:alpha/beta fold hydrolase [Colwellia sp. MT41]
MIRKIGMILVITFALVFGYWYSFLALDEISMEQAEIIKQYQYNSEQAVELILTEIEPHLFTFTYKSFDQSIVNGQISYPKNQADKYPVLIGISAMGRGYQRWWSESFKGRPTVTQVNKITELADKNGYVVISIDARYHGKRKNPDRTLRSIMNDLHFFGDKTDYEAMIKNTVIDHRVLLDWVSQQNNLDKSNISVVGYSMGGQIGLILASLDQRISKIISIVPPYLDDKTALVAPKNFISLLKNQDVLLLTADDDENASKSENDFIFKHISTPKKERIVFSGGHILPDNYVDSLSNILAN